MALHDDWLTSRQKCEIDRLWRTKWKAGRKPNSHWVMLRKLKDAGVDIRNVECDWHIPPIDEKLPDWQISLSRRSSDPDFLEEIFRDRRAYLQLANETSGTEAKQLGAKNAAAKKRANNAKIVEAFKRANSVPNEVKPRAIHVADWLIRTQGLPNDEKHNLVRRLKVTGVVR